MGAGKSTVGRMLAEALGLRFIDLDEVIEARAGAAIALIFELEGEAGFREREARALDEVSREHGIVLATGGGVVLRAENRARLKQRGLVIHLATDVETQLERLARDRRRPLLVGVDRRQRLEQLAEVREPLYRALADLSVHSGGRSVKQVCERVLHRLRDEYRWPGIPHEGAH
jgi:shikimate kinase